MFACLLAPDFPVQAALRSDQDTRTLLHQSLVVVVDGPPNLQRVVALNESARSAGIGIGMTKLQAETCDGVSIRKRSAESEQSAQLALIECAHAFSPRVESTCPGTVILDLSGTDKLFGSKENTAHQIVSAALELGFDLRVAIASNPDTAFYAASGFPGITIISPGEEAKRLQSLPIGVLPASPNMLEVLENWGIRTLRSFAELPPIALVERLGQEALHLQKLARGQTDRPLLCVKPAAEFSESFEFEDPVETQESLTFILNRLLQAICARLTSYSLATSELRLMIGLEVRQIQNGGQNGEQFKREWKLPLPTQDRNMLLKLISLDLESNLFSAPIKKLTIEAVPVKPRMAQGNLFAPPSPESEKLEITLARIRGVVGSTDAEGMACLGSPQLVDTHKPGSFRLQSFSGVTEAVSSLPISVPMVALRTFRPALEASVQLEGEKPHFVWLWHRHRRVLAASGPWCNSGNWWNGSVWARAEWDVALKMPEGIGYYRIYLDQLSKQWFVQGFFD